MTVLAAMGLLILTETGVPIPVPGDLMMLLVGERSSAGDIPLWAAIAALEVVTIAGTVALYAAARGPARGLVTRLGPRVGLTEDRLERVTRVVGRRTTVALGRMTPGTRTLTVIGCATAPLPWRATLPALLIGSTIFVQGHLVLGYTLGPVARAGIEAARGPVLIVLSALIAGAIGLWVARRGWRGGEQTFSEAACPACLVAGLARAATEHSHS